MTSFDTNSHNMIPTLHMNHGVVYVLLTKSDTSVNILYHIVVVDLSPLKNTLYSDENKSN
jgi:hypothetical protein